MRFTARITWWPPFEDMQRWDRALDGAKLVKKETLAQALERGRLNSGARTEYGFGWQMERYDGHPVVSHTGGWAGYRTWIWRCPDLHESMILLTNTHSPRMIDLRKTILQVIQSDAKN